MTKQRLIEEMQALRTRVAALEQSESRCQQAEEALRVSESRYRELAQNANSAIIRWARDGTILFFNEYAQTLFGYSSDEIIGKNVSILVPDIESTGGDLERLAEAIIAHPEGFVNNINQNICRDGRRMWMAWTNKLILDENGQVSEILAIGVDVTKDKQAQEALRKNEERYRRIILTLTDYIYTVRVEDGRAVETTHGPACIAVTGYTSEDFAANADLWLQMVDEEDRPAVLEQARRLLGGQGAQPVEHRITRKDGVKRWVRNTPVLHHDLNGKLLSYDGLIQDITERKLIEEALRESEAKYRTLVENATMGVGISVGNRIVFANPALLRIFGYSSLDELVKIPLLDHVAASSRDYVADLMKKRAAGYRAPAEFEYDILRGDKDIRTLRATSAQIVFGGETCSLTTFEDITERKRAETALRESEERFRRAIKEAPFPIMMHAEDGEVIAISDTWLELTGYALQDISTVAKWTERAFGDRCHLVKAEIDRLYGLATKVNEGEYTITTNRGRSRLWDFSSTPLGTLPDGRRLVLSMAVDVTERHLSEEALLQASDRLALAQESAGAGVWDWDMLTGQLDWSPELFRLLGLKTVPSPTFDLWRSVLYPDEWQMVKDQIDEAIRNHKPLHSEYRIVKSTGEVRWINLLGNTIYDEHGRARRMSGICIDVTDRKRMEEALHRTNLELQARNEELDAFGHTVAHDLKNPLGSIIGFANLLTDEENPLSVEATHELARDFEELSLRMDNIIEELMLLAGLRKAEIKMGPLDMAHIVAEAQRRLTPMIRGSGAEITGPSSWPPATGHASWVEEIWINYMSNAIKYGGQPPRIELGAVQQGDRVCFWVRDHGKGLTEEQKARLFQPFERLGQVNLKGHGLGLSIVQRIAERMGGQAYVESTGIPGEGCTFGFILPISVDQAP